MKDECHGDLAFLFSYPQSYLWGNHFHEPGGIHLNLPSSFTSIVPAPDKNVKFFSSFFRMVAGVGVEPTKTGL